jgi:ABC-type cobalamin/Fe3+-siderophores transport system ATPase subunit
MTLGTSSPALSARGIRAQLGNTLALDGLDIDIAVGRWTSIVGPNGAGKSTLLKVLAGLIAHHGVVHLHGQSMADWPARDRARQLAWLGQSEGAGDDLTVWEVALLGRLPHQAWLSKPNAKDHSAVEQALRQTQAWDWRQRTLGQLSGGERQRVLLARALSVQASVLLMDEPLVNLDPPHQADWLQIVRALVAQGTTVVSVLHEISMALNADNIVVMAKGRITHQGACSDAASHRALEQTFDRRIAIHGVQDQWVALVRSAQL